MTACDRFPFLYLPYELQLEVLRKMPVSDILSARLCSSAMNNLIERHRLSLPCRIFPRVEFHPVMNDETHMIYDEGKFVRLFKNGEIGGLTISYMEITEEFLESLRRAMSRNRIRVYRLGLDYCRISVDFRSFARILEIMAIFELSIVHSIAINESFAGDLARTSVVRKLERFGILLPTGVSDDYLMESGNEWLAMIGTNISSTAVNHFLKEWIECRRSFEYIALELLDEIDCADILYDIDYNFVEGSLSIQNKYGEQRKIGVIGKCIQIYSDDAFSLMEKH